MQIYDKADEFLKVYENELLLLDLEDSEVNEDKSTDASINGTQSNNEALADADINSTLDESTAGNRAVDSSESYTIPQGTRY